MSVNSQDVPQEDLNHLMVAFIVDIYHFAVDFHDPARDPASFYKDEVHEIIQGDVPSVAANFVRPDEALPQVLLLQFPACYSG